MKNKISGILVTVFFAVPFTFSLCVNMAFATAEYPVRGKKNNMTVIELKDIIQTLQPSNTESALPSFEDEHSSSTETITFPTSKPSCTVTPSATLPSSTPAPTVTPSITCSPTPSASLPTAVPSPTATPSVTPYPTIPNGDDKTSNEQFNDEKIIVNVFDKTENEVVQMTLHDYLIGVVAAEMPATFELEALKAQAVAARTFTVKHMSSSCSSNSKAHVCTYYGCCQAYVSVDKMKKNWNNSFEEKYNKVRQAVESTDSLIITYNNAPITVFYFSTSNGYTEACQDVFVKNLPYYKSVESAGEENVSGFTSYVKISKKEFCTILKDNFDIDISEDNIEQSLKFKYTPGNRVDYVYFNGIAVRGTAFRKAFGLKSADFKFTFYDDYILIDVCGYGHGVGMSQNGANTMAKNGAKFDEIIKHYYIDIQISHIK